MLLSSCLLCVNVFVWFSWSRAFRFCLFLSSAFDGDSCDHLTFPCDLNQKPAWGSSLLVQAIQFSNAVSRHSGKYTYQNHNHLVLRRPKSRISPLHCISSMYYRKRVPMTLIHDDLFHGDGSRPDSGNAHSAVNSNDPHVVHQKA